jgi:hypothetical protein
MIMEDLQISNQILRLLKEYTAHFAAILESYLPINQNMETSNGIQAHGNATLGWWFMES